MADEFTFNIVDSAVQDKVFQQHVAERKLVLNYEVDESCFMDIGDIILRFNKEDEGFPVEKRKPVRLYIMCNGGSVIDGLALINIIRTSKTPVYTVVVGQAFSMAAYIAMSGHKHYAFPDAMFLIHDGSIGFAETQRKAKDLMDFNERVSQKLDGIVLNRTKITQEEIDKNMRVEWYMFADDAKEKGIVDYIVGEDCEIEEVC